MTDLMPPLVNGYCVREFSYTPIYIEYVTPVLVVENGIDAEPVGQHLTPAKLRITNPSSRLAGARQAFSKPQFISIPDEGPIYLKLLPSDLYIPNGVYKIEVLFTSSSSPVDIQHWVVPYRSDEKTVEIIASGELQDAMPHAEDEAVFSISEVSREGEYTLNRDIINWVEPPIRGERYQVTYQPGVTIDQLIQV